MLFTTVCVTTPIIKDTEDKGNSGQTTGKLNTGFTYNTHTLTTKEPENTLSC